MQCKETAEKRVRADCDCTTANTTLAKQRRCQYAAWNEEAE